MTKILRNSIPVIEKGAANGVATLDGSQKIPASQLPTSVREFKGNWDASTNTPTLSSGVGTNGDTYRVSVSGSTDLDGITDWQDGDEATFNGSSGVWEKSPYTESSDRVVNNSGVTGGTVTDALNQLDSSKANATHTHTESEITDLDKYSQSQVDTLLSGKEDSFSKNTAFNKNFGSSAGTVCEGNDSRLSDITDSGALAGKNTVGTSDIDNDAVTNAKMADNSVNTAEIVNDAVTNAKLANMAVNRIKGRVSAGSGDPEDLTVAQVQALLAPPRVSSQASTSTLTVDMSSTDIASLTALATALTIAAPTGSPSNGRKLIIRIKDNGTARAITWNAIFRAIGVTLPTTTVTSKWLYVGMIYNSTDTKWDVVAVNQEA